ncbi:MAG: ComEC/Rec2 family competence protein [Candidatus Auribacterota bacterium]
MINLSQNKNILTYNYPLLIYVSCCFITGILWAKSFQNALFYITLSSISVILILFIRKNPVFFLIGCCIAAFITGAYRTNRAERNLQFQFQEMHRLISTREQTGFSAVIRNFAETTYFNSRKMMRMYVRTDKNNAALPGGINLILYMPAEKTEVIPHPGDRVVFNAVRLRNPGRFRLNRHLTYREYLKNREILATGSCESMRIVSRSWFYEFINRIRDKLIRHLSAGIPASRELELVKAMVIGTKPDISYDLLHQFSVMGVIHILVISGMHIGLFAILGFSLLQMMGLPRKTVYIVMIPILSGYMMLTGSRVSVVRAVIMIFFYWGADITKRERSPLNAIAAAALIQLTACPFLLYDHGFQYSFISLLAIVYIYPLFTAGRSHPIIRHVLQYPLVSLSVCMLIVPVTAYHHSYFSFAGLITGALAGAAASLILTAGFASCIAGYLSSGISAIFNHFNYIAMKGIIALNTFFCDVLNTRRYFSDIPPEWLYAYYSIVLLSIVFLSGKTLKRAIIITAFAGILALGTL